MIDGRECYHKHKVHLSYYHFEYRYDDVHKQYLEYRLRAASRRIYIGETRTIITIIPVRFKMTRRQGYILHLPTFSTIRCFNFGVLLSILFIPVEGKR
jgi:hypothetical protein